ncbi:MAG: hypothetical protein ACRYFZ_08125 [Janthinobacterium lividum]
MLTVFVRRVLPMLLLGTLGLSSCVVRPYGPPPPPRGHRHGYGRPYGPPPPPPGPYRRGY